MKRTPEQEDARMAALLLEHGSLRQFRPVTCGAWPIRKGDQVERDGNDNAVPHLLENVAAWRSTTPAAVAIEDAEPGQQLYVELLTGDGKRRIR